MGSVVGQESSQIPGTARRPRSSSFMEYGARQRDGNEHIKLNEYIGKLCQILEPCKAITPLDCGIRRVGSVGTLRETVLLP